MVGWRFGCGGQQGSRARGATIPDCEGNSGLVLFPMFLSTQTLRLELLPGMTIDLLPVESWKKAALNYLQ